MISLAGPVRIDPVNNTLLVGNALVVLLAALLVLLIGVPRRYWR